MMTLDARIIQGSSSNTKFPLGPYMVGRMTPYSGNFLYDCLDKSR